MDIRPQEGPQEDFLATPADIAIYGGAAGGGKTWSLLAEPLRHIENEKFGGVIFRRTTPEITKEGALWDQSLEIYAGFDGYPIETKLRWKFPSGSRISFGHLEHEKDKFKYQGTQIPFIGFDELTHFTVGQFFYLLSRNRSTSGVRGYCRASCNPDPDSWVANFISWWIDEETGLAIPERSGVLRWFIRLAGEIIWADTKEELEENYTLPNGKPALPKSVTFIHSKLEDNKILLEKDPDYLATLEALPLVERERLREGNWKIRPNEGSYFKRSDFIPIDKIDLPVNRKIIRYWDRAGTERSKGTAKKNNPDWTVGGKVSEDTNGNFYVEDINRFQGKPDKVEAEILSSADFDGKKVTVGLEQDPGSAGVFEVAYYVKKLAGYDLHINKVATDKEMRARPASSQARQGNIYIVRGSWNDAFLAECNAFPVGSNDDQVDILSGAIDYFTSARIAGRMRERNRKGKTMAPSHKSSEKQW